ncbi:pseudaminic acid cytidylyltransferase [Caballeronia sp. LP006]|uniref:pseudaminic acid cytidylyltransferase n=1 Tax=Caballeronia sp. LP006 TaxID=3038552 RepID=UPI0028584F06|nr:pseudaminic acid cytidylyltransferase [Caballeronia sp. LP006]MDR5831959.1 pseudaminic acid cytidylyltransferase [Caballeronia sp. LP006]
MNIAVIPARGGSKRITRKNIKEFAGKPMIGYAIAAAVESKLFDHVIVSTDDEEIAAISASLGADVPFLRPKNLADDHTATVPVIKHAIEACADIGCQAELVCCIYPCVPLIAVEDLNAAAQKLKASRADYCFPVARFETAPQRAIKIGADRCRPAYPEFQQVRTQDLEPLYYDAGQFYFGRAQSWLSGKALHSNACPIVIPAWRAIDIDTSEDWERTQALYASMSNHS